MGGTLSRDWVVRRFSSGKNRPAYDETYEPTAHRRKPPRSRPRSGQEGRLARPVALSRDAFERDLDERQHEERPGRSHAQGSARRTDPRGRRLAAHGHRASLGLANGGRGGAVAISRAAVLPG